jgi:hypothetical protein
MHYVVVLLYLDRHGIQITAAESYIEDYESIGPPKKTLPCSQPRGFSSCEPLQKRDDHDPSTEIRPFRF